MNEENQFAQPRFYCVKEASAHSGFSLAELYQLARLGRISHAREGQQLRFTPEDLDDYLRQSQANEC